MGPIRSQICSSLLHCDTVNTGHGTPDWVQIGKRVHQGCILSPAYLTHMQSTS